MKKRKSKKFWQEIFELRKSFEGSTAEFCRQYDVPNSSYYTHHKAFLTEEEISNLSKIKSSTSKRKPAFIQVSKPAKPSTMPSASHILFNTKTSELSLPTSLETQHIVAIIKGLMT